MELNDRQSLIALGLSVVALVYMVRRLLLRIAKPRGRESMSRDSAETETAEAGALGATEMLELRLFDFAREVEGRMQTRIAVLDRLIIDADREILRLQELLVATKREAPWEPVSPTSAHERLSNATAEESAHPRQPDALIELPSVNTSTQRDAA